MILFFKIKNLPILIVFFFAIFTTQNASATCLGVNCTCSITAIAVSFGSYDPFSSSSVDSTGNVRVTCTALLVGLTVSYQIFLSQGGGGSFSPRKLSNGISNLEYNLYSDSARTTIWGDGTGGTGSVSDSYNLSLTSVARDYVVYGRIPGAQNVSVGTYNDVITATVEF